MQTKIFKVNSAKLDKGTLDTVVEVLRQDGVMVYPTETFYGLGANALSPPAIQKVYRLKAREENKPLSVVISDLEMLKGLVAEVPAVFGPLSKDFWPGPLTLVLKASPKVPPELERGTGTIGVRLPAVPWIWTLLDRAGFPLTATSANLSGEQEIADPESVIRGFKGKVDVILDSGNTPGSRPSTVLDLTLERPHILREGVIPEADLRRYWD